MTLRILGETWNVEYRTYQSDPYFEKRNADGYCLARKRLIVVGELETFQAFEGETKEVIEQHEKEILRHEIVHAFFYESGLDASSMTPDCGWAMNEEMVDWIALQGPKIFSVWMEAGAL